MLPYLALRSRVFSCMLHQHRVPFNPDPEHQRRLHANHRRTPLHAGPCRRRRHLLAYQKKYRIAVLDKWAHLRIIGDLLLLFLPHVKRCEFPYLLKAAKIFFDVTLLTRNSPRYFRGSQLLAGTINYWKTECGWMFKNENEVPPNHPE